MCALRNAELERHQKITLRHMGAKCGSLLCAGYFPPVSISVSIALSTVFYSINSSENSVFSLSSSVLISVLLVLSTIYLFLEVSFRPGIIPSGWLGSKHQLTKLTNTGGYPVYRGKSIPTVSELAYFTGPAVGSCGRRNKKVPSLENTGLNPVPCRRLFVQLVLFPLTRSPEASLSKSWSQFK